MNWQTIYLDEDSTTAEYTTTRWAENTSYVINNFGAEVKDLNQAINTISNALKPKKPIIDRLREKYHIKKVEI